MAASIVARTLPAGPTRCTAGPGSDLGPGVRWGPFLNWQDRLDQPLRSPLRTATPGTIRMLFDDVSIRATSRKTFRSRSEALGAEREWLLGQGRFARRSPLPDKDCKIVYNRAVQLE
jgi:hypothetical protein